MELTAERGRSTPFCHLLVRAEHNDSPSVATSPELLTQVLVPYRSKNGLDRAAMCAKLAVSIRTLSNLGTLSDMANEKSPVLTPVTLQTDVTVGFVTFAEQEAIDSPISRTPGGL